MSRSSSPSETIRDAKPPAHRTAGLVRPSQRGSGGPRGSNEAKKVERRGALGAYGRGNDWKPRTGRGAGLASNAALSESAVSRTSLHQQGQASRPHKGHGVSLLSSGVMSPLVTSNCATATSDCGIAFTSEAKIAVRPSRSSATEIHAARRGWCWRYMRVEDGCTSPNKRQRSSQPANLGRQSSHKEEGRLRGSQ